MIKLLKIVLIALAITAACKLNRLLDNKIALAADLNSQPITMEESDGLHDFLFNMVQKAGNFLSAQ